MCGNPHAPCSSLSGFDVGSRVAQLTRKLDSEGFFLPHCPVRPGVRGVPTTIATTSTSNRSSPCCCCVDLALFKSCRASETRTARNHSWSCPYSPSSTRGGIARPWTPFLGCSGIPWNGIEHLQPKPISTPAPFNRIDTSTHLNRSHKRICTDQEK